MTTKDRLDEIKKLYHYPSEFIDTAFPCMAWLIGEVERLRNMTYSHIYEEGKVIQVRNKREIELESEIESLKKQLAEAEDLRIKIEKDNADLRSRLKIPEIVTFQDLADRGAKLKDSPDRRE